MNDLSFLGDLVNSSASFLEQPEPSEPKQSSLSTEHERPDRTRVMCSMPTPISPPGQQGDKVSGLESLAQGHVPAVPEPHIPPGLFIDIGVIKSGFLGRCKILSTHMIIERSNRIKLCWGYLS